MPKAHVLVVDDDERILSNLKILMEGDYRVFTARSAEEGRVILRRERVHVVVSDYRMPGQDGLSFLVETKREHPGAARLLLTAHGDLDLVVRAINVGEVHRFVTKPYRGADLLRTIGECARIGGASPAREPRGGRRKAVLLAHDSRLCLSTLKAALSPHFEVLTTRSGMEALTFIAERHIDALVTGIGIQTVDGCTITAYLKGEKRAAFPVVVWSRDLTKELERYLRSCGADLVVDERRPSAPGELLSFLRGRLF